MTRRILSAAILWCAAALVIPKYEYILQRVTRRRRRVIILSYYRLIYLRVKNSIIKKKKFYRVQRNITKHKQ